MQLKPLTEHPLIYLSGPIAPFTLPNGGRHIETDEHVHTALSAYWKMTAAGMLVYCPHLNVGLANRLRVDELDYEHWMQVDLAAVRAASAIYLLPYWEHSAGARREVAEAVAHKLTIFPTVHDAIQQVVHRIHDEAPRV